jgi:PAS domain S-box-containing protein
MKIRSKFLLSISFLILIVTGLVVIVINRLQEQSVLVDRRVSAFDLAYVLAHSSVQAIVADDYLVLQEILDSVHSKKDIVHAMILDTEGNVLVHNETKFVGQRMTDSLSVNAVQSISERSIRIQHDGIPAWDVSVPILIVNERVGTARIIFSLESAYGEIARTRNTVLVIGAFAFVGGIFLSIVLGRVIARPLYKLVEATRRIGKGDLMHRVNIVSGDEIGELARSFDHMADGLVERDEQIEEKMAQLSELSSYNENILQSMSSGVITVDLKGNIVTFNRSAESITGLNRDDVKGKDVRSILSFDPSFRKMIFRALSSGKEKQNLEEQYTTPQGEELTLQVSIRLLKNINGDAIGVLTVFNDLTEIKKLEEDMKRAERLAALGTTAASIAHEIRTPLTSLSTFAELLPMKYNDPRFRERFQAIIPGQVDRLTNLVNDLLDFARVETLHLEETDIHPIIKDATDILMGKAVECGVRITLDLAPHLPNIHVDPDHISQVFLNIIQNALQAMPNGGALTIATAFQDHGGITLKSEPKRTLVKGYVEIAFTDTGIGISEENLGKLFEPFFTTRSKGTGLGLAISYRIVREHGGTIQVQSEAGKGTTFTVQLPKQIDQEDRD